MTPPELTSTDRRGFLGWLSSVSLLALSDRPPIHVVSATGIQRVPLTGRVGAARGANDDSPALQAAIRRAPAGSVVEVPSGHYTLKSRLLVDRPISLSWGAGMVVAPTGWLLITADGVAVTAAGGGRTHVTCERPWDGENLCGVEVRDATGFTLSGVDIDTRRTGSAVHPQTMCAGILVRGRSTRFLIERNRVTASGSEPDRAMRYFGIFAWSATPHQPILCGQGIIRDNWILDTAGRCIEVALCQNVTITGNVIAAGGSEATIVCVGIRVIGSENISVVGNTVEITGGDALQNADCLQVNGDNLSKGITLSGNSCRTNAGGGTGVKIGGNASHVAITGNTVWYTGRSTRPRGILVTSNPPLPALPPSDIMVSGNVVWGFPAQLGVARATSATSYPSRVSFVSNRLGRSHDGERGPRNFVDVPDAELDAHRIVLRDNDTDLEPGAP